MSTTTGMDAEREFWIGLRSTYIQQIRLVRDRFEVNLYDPDGTLAAGVCVSLMSAVSAIERRYGLPPWSTA